MSIRTGVLSRIVIRGNLVDAAEEGCGIWTASARPYEFLQPNPVGRAISFLASHHLPPKRLGGRDSAKLVQPSDKAHLHVPRQPFKVPDKPEQQVFP